MLVTCIIRMNFIDFVEVELKALLKESSTSHKAVGNVNDGATSEDQQTA
jgi:hypothetical protein